MPLPPPRRGIPPRAALSLPALAGALFLVGGCAAGMGPGWGSVAFDTARVWVVSGPDSVPLTVEVAETDRQREVGLRDRPALPPDAGMLFLLDEPRAGDEGFWMWRTRIPLDIAFLNGDGRIVAILAMEPCPGPDPGVCPEYAPGVAYGSALEVNRGWFTRNGVEVGDRVRLER